MSLEAINWVLNEAPDVPPSLVATLLALANHADPSGKGAAPSHARMAFYTRKTDRSVRRDLADLETLKLIRRGDQRRVAYLPADRRPVVWDLAMERTRPIPDHLDVHAEPRSGTSTINPHPVDNRADTHVPPAAPVPPPRKPGGRARPPAHTAVSRSNGHRADTHVRRTLLEEEVKTSSALDQARDVLSSLGEPWKLGQRTIEQLAPAVATALQAGWPAERLHAHLSANPDGVRSPAAVLRARIVDLPTPPKPATPPPSAPKQPCPKHQGETIGKCGRCRSEEIARA